MIAFFLNLILTPMADWQLHYMRNVIISTLQLSTFLFYVVILYFYVNHLVLIGCENLD
jgi:hypothetical protein